CILYCVLILSSFHLHMLPYSISSFLFLTDTPTTQLYTLSLHDALPISMMGFPGISALSVTCSTMARSTISLAIQSLATSPNSGRSEEHTSELQSPYDLVCRLLLEKKKKK